MCATCGLPPEVCACEERERETVSLHVRLETRRYGKQVTIVEGFEGGYVQTERVAKALKSACAAGGTAKEGRVELQGDHAKRAVEILKGMGFQVEA